METIQQLLGEKYLEKFKVFYPSTLFPPNWDALKVARCPLCSNKLKSPQNGKIFYCSGKKHPKQFLIKREVMEKILGSIKSRELSSLLIR